MTDLTSVADDGAKPALYDELLFKLVTHLEVTYESAVARQTAQDIAQLMGFEQRIQPAPEYHGNWDNANWNESDVLMITYGDTVLDGDRTPLHVLKAVLDQRLKNVVSGVHILPFYPFSSDDGFAVINYLEVNESLGQWPDIEAIAQDYRLMADLVVNHCSSRSLWFENFKQRKDPGKDYFFEAQPSDDLSMVVRPRTSPLLRETETLDGERYVWCTFSHDQVDFDFRNPKVLLEFIEIIRYYLDRGVRIFRLDAVAFLWKRVGDPSLNLIETHEIVRLFRTVIEHYEPSAILITETNIPNRENLSYFGNANEAHMVYNFSLPPLLVNALVTGSSQYLRTWLMGMPPAQNGTTYFNFIASHDGIGLRPAEGLLADEEIDALAAHMQKVGGKVSWRSLDGNQVRPYEINISLFDALSTTLGDSAEDEFAVRRFVCAHAIMFALEGVPAIYIHSLMATRNDYTRMEHTGHNRAINRHQWQLQDLDQVLDDDSTHHAQVFDALNDLLTLRKRQPAFHPNATQFALQLGDGIFGFWRQSLNRVQSIFVLNNVSAVVQTVPITSLNLVSTESWSDLISGDALDDDHAEIELQPYQTLWISNTRSQS